MFTGHPTASTPQGLDNPSSVRPCGLRLKEGAWEDPPSAPPLSASGWENPKRQGKERETGVSHRDGRQPKPMLSKEAKARFISSLSPSPRTLSLLLRLHAPLIPFANHPINYSSASSIKEGVEKPVFESGEEAAALRTDTSMMMMNGRHIPAFGSWDYCDDLPITQYFESAMQAGVIRPGNSSAQEDNADLFPPVKSADHQKKAKTGGGGVGGGERQAQPRKQMGRVCDVSAQAATAATARRTRAAKAVDEDLYKIPPELLCQRPKRKRLLRSLWSGCLGISCSAGA